MSLNRKQYYTSGRSFNAKGNKNMLNAIERNAFNPTRKLKGKKQSFVNPELQGMKCGGKVHKMELGGEYKFEPTIGQTYDDFTVQGGWSDQRGLGFAPDKRVWDGEKWVGQQHRSTDPVSKEEQAIADKLRQEFLNSDAGMELRELVAQNNASFGKFNPMVEALAKKEFAKQNPESVGYEMQYGGLTKLVDGTPGTSLALQNISKGYRGRKGLLTPWLGYSGGRWGGGASGTPESNYGFTGGIDYSLPLKFRDTETSGNIGGGVYAGDFGLGVKGFQSFGSDWDAMAIGNSIPKMRGTTTLGFDKVRGIYGDFKASQNYPIIEKKDEYLTVGPTGGFGIQSKDMIKDPALADDIISKMNLQYGLTGSYGRKVGDGIFNVTADVTADPIAGKVAKKENADTDRVHFAPRFNVTGSYTLPLQKDKIKGKLAEQKARDEAIQREAEALARREEELKRRSETGQSEFVREVGGAPLEQQFGGEVMELTDAEIAKLRKGGHIVIEQ